MRTVSETIQIADKKSVNNFNGIDLIKFLCSFLVCIIHIAPFQGEGTLQRFANFGLQNYLCRIAVPYYFVCSGFFLFHKMTPEVIETTRIKNYCLKILRLLGTWVFLLFAGGRNQLWYLNALVLSVLILSLMFKAEFHLRTIFFIVSILYAVGMLGDAYSGVFVSLNNFPIVSLIRKSYTALFTTTRNGLFFGPLFLLVGATFAFRRITINPVVSLIGFLLSMIVLAIEVACLHKFSKPADYNMMISLVPTSFFLFAIASTINLKDRPIYRRLRIVGVLVYYTHLLVNFFTGYVLQSILRIWGFDMSSYQFLFCLLLTILLSFMIECLSKRDAWRWLHHLYS